MRSRYRIGHEKRSNNAHSKYRFACCEWKRSCVSPRSFIPLFAVRNLRLFSGIFFTVQRRLRKVDVDCDTLELKAKAAKKGGFEIPARFRLRCAAVTAAESASFVPAVAMYSSSNMRCERDEDRRGGSISRRGTDLYRAAPVFSPPLRLLPR